MTEFASYLSPVHGPEVSVAHRVSASRFWERPDIISYDPLGRGSANFIHLHSHNLFTIEAGGVGYRTYCKQRRQKFTVTEV